MSWINNKRGPISGHYEKKLFKLRKTEGVQSTNIHPDRPPGELKAAPSAPCLVEEGELLGLKMFLLLKMLLLFVNPPNGFLFGN